MMIYTCHSACARSLPFLYVYIACFCAGKKGGSGSGGGGDDEDDDDDDDDGDDDDVA